MKKFWGRSSGSKSTADVNRNGPSSSSNSLADNDGDGATSNAPFSTDAPRTPTSPASLPSRKQRMLLLKCIIHHADAVQKRYLVPKQLASPTADKSKSSGSAMDNVSSIFVRGDAAAAEINNKCYQRWHQVLQEGLVPMSVHALNLLERAAAAATGTGGGGGASEDDDDEEEAYFATMEGMDEEIQIMAILARAAALDDRPFERGVEGCAGEERKAKDGEEKTAKDSDGMERINDVMKCTAMLIFHVVLAASTPGSSPSGSSQERIAEAAKHDAVATVAGYDGRVRHVMKSACVDVLTRAILESVEAFDGRNASSASDEKCHPPGLHGMDETSGWSIASIKAFLDQEDLGKNAVFGTPFKGGNSGGNKLLLVEREKKTQARNEQQKRQSQPETDEQTVSSEDLSNQTQSKENDEISTTRERPLKTVESLGSKDSSDASSSLEVLAENALDPETDSLENNPTIREEGDDEETIEVNRRNRSQEERLNEDPGSKPNVDLPKDSNGGDRSQEVNDDAIVDWKHSDKDQGEGDGPHPNPLMELRARRQFNAKFLATRKFELIERLIAIDIVRFLMAEERAKRLREQELEARTSSKKLSSLLKKSSSDAQGGSNDDGNSNDENNVDESSEQITNTGSQIFTASRVKQIKRGAKIAGCGLALGTVFAITGGLAAPALAAGIGGIAALTGASTASSAALLAVLATFKAGAALFGVGGGGLAAYKMKKRTAGLSQFEIRRENVEQYMYVGASDEKMKKGIESMLPQLHTTIVVSGWLRHYDIADFQLCWGVQPTCKYEDPYDFRRRIRQMKRFYAVYNPPLVYLCESFMKTLQRRLKKQFSWDRIWSSLQEKYGANPDTMLPIDSPHENEVRLSNEERYMIDGVLNDAKIINLRKRFGHGNGIEFNGDDEISQLLSQVSPEKLQRKSMDSEAELDLDKVEMELEHDLVTMQSGQSNVPLDESTTSVYLDEQNQRSAKKEIEMSALKTPSSGSRGNAPLGSATAVGRRQRGNGDSLGTTTLPGRVPIDGHPATSEISPSLQERAARQREQQVSFLKEKGLIEDKSNLQEGAESPKISDSDSEQNPPDKHQPDEDPPDRNEEALPQEYEDERSPVVWDWKALYGVADIHTISWESKMLSSLCHIVENMALEVSSQATKVALQYSVIGAIVSAVAIPSALVTASKLIDDPYQIVVIRADEAGKELAKCLLMSDERRPVTLVGFSFGARVVYSALRELARQQDIWEESRVSKYEESENKTSSFLSKKNNEGCQFKYDREPASLVGDVIFIGLPRAIDKKVITSCRRVTGGRFINCYTTNDWLLSLMFVARGGVPCGTKPIKGVPGVENYDVTHLVESHTKYGDAIPNILQCVRFAEP